MENKGGRVLVVDDNRMNRVKLAHSLEQQGHTVGLAEDGRQALERLESEPFDVILLDIVMPEMDGYQVLERVKSHPQLRDIPVIVISAVDEMDSVVRCIEMGAEDYLPKPFNPVLLRARLDASLRKKKLRSLEVAYLQQEVMLRESEKLATLGRLSAGLAHELNNPAAAAARSAGELQAALASLQAAYSRLGESGLSAGQREVLHAHLQDVRAAGMQPVEMGTLARGDAEDEMERWLDGRGMGNSWELAPLLVSLGYDIPRLAALAEQFAADQLPAVLSWLGTTINMSHLLDEIGQGVGRISRIVQALKAYSYMDQAPVQPVNVNDSLESTLAVLAGRLDRRVRVRRELGADLPRVEAFGGELNQVWTHLIENALDALDGLAGEGEVVLRTRREDGWVVVEVEDNGPGIPEQLQSKIFDPFFTTKPPGAGTGLGLSIAQHIVVQKHQGQLRVFSGSGRTCFQVKLPLQPVQPGSHGGLPLRANV